MSNPNANYGFLCDFDSRNIYFIKEIERAKLLKGNVKFYAHGSNVTTDTIATMPKNLPGLEKFQGKIWSQYLGFLRDPKNKFAETMCGDELGWVTVKYAPDGDTVFEIVDVVQNCTVHLPKEELLPTFQLEFPFDHDVLESLENRSTIGWYQRTKGLKKDAHFWDPYLGKVKIYPRHAKEIIQKVEAYRQDLLEPFKSEPITVVGEVVCHRKSYENNKKYPKFGIFLVKNVIGIKDVKGKIINV
ncbi:hypothetical protein L5515_002362 [Caenorhabditis briggsae]|uniref:Uncharacterized protein n=1 Tax=Caenorhabditis briggsae TaxID=6238 RepID=A0AAE9E602_CAEBR|nr:hypothetical protein L5515_002362 [Caenorhabditis briggsae]